MYERIRLGMKVEKALLEEKGDMAVEVYVNDRDGFEDEKRDVTEALIEARKTIKTTGAISWGDFNYLPKGVQDLLPKTLIIKDKNG